MSQFKLGDKVIIRSGVLTPSNAFTGEAIFHGDSEYDMSCVALEICNGSKNGKGSAQNGWWNFKKSDLWVLELTNKKTMSSITSLKQKVVSVFLSEPEKSFRRKGVTNGDGFLTSEGTEVFLSFLLKKFGAEFKTEVVDKIAEDKE